MNQGLQASVVILNYNGSRVIERTIVSVMKSSMPITSFDVIVVDNNSKDNSKTILENIRAKYRNMQVVYSPINLGFSKGNNVGMRLAKGKYVVILNNDCIVEKSWLRELIRTADRDDRIFAVNSKILLYPAYQKITFILTDGLTVNDAWLIASNLLYFSESKKIPINWGGNNGDSFLELPFDPKRVDKEIGLVLKLKKINLIKNPNKQVKFAGLKGWSYEVQTLKETQKFVYVRILLRRLKTKLSLYDKVQNAGIVVFQDGYGRDIGAQVKNQTQDYEVDYGQYNEEREIYASCGASSLYRKDLLEVIGYFDESFFMYYEDVELSERARLKGYKVIYSPNSVLRHLHALSSEEWSPFFIYHVEKGRLIHLMYNFPIIVFFVEYVLFSVKMLIKSRYILKNKKMLQLSMQHLRVIIFIFFNLIPMLISRAAKNYGRRVRQNNYRSILSGYWYFN